MFLKKIILLFLILTTINLSAQNRFSSEFSLTNYTTNDFQNELNKTNTYTNLDVTSNFTNANNTLAGNTPTILDNYLEKNNKQFNLMPTTTSISSSLYSKDLETAMRAMKRRRRSGMEKTGRILTFIGVPLGIIGGIMVASADELYYECVNGNCSGDAKGGFGVVMLGAGIGLSGTGTVLWVLGRRSNIKRSF